MKSFVVALIAICSLALMAIVSVVVFFTIIKTAPERTAKSYAWQLEFEKQKNKSLGIGISSEKPDTTTFMVVEEKTESTEAPTPSAVPVMDSGHQEERKWERPMTYRPKEIESVDNNGGVEKTTTTRKVRPSASVVRVTPPWLLIDQPSTVVGGNAPPVIGGRLHVLEPLWPTDESITEAPTSPISEEQRRFRDNVQMVNTNRGNILKLRPNSSEVEERTAVAYLPPVSPELEFIYQQHRADIQFKHSRQMTKYGKVVGLALRNQLLYVPAHRRGSISVLTTPELSILEELSCPRCRIYDLVALSNGDLVIAQGKAKKLTKLDRKTKKISKQIRLRYSTKGLAVGFNDEVYVLSRSHDKLYRYDSFLNLLEVIPIPNDANDDCNFVKVSADNKQLYVSCQNQVYVLTAQGQLIRRLRATRGPLASYSVGVDVTTDGRLLVVRRGKAQLDVFDVDTGAFVETVGPDVQTLWSDMELAGDYAYVVDYLSATIRAIKFR